jgi:O-antigen ligase
VEKFKNSRAIYLIPLFLLVAIVPLIVFYKPVPLGGLTFKAWPVSTTNADFFSYYKAKWILIFTFLSSCTFCIYAFKEKTIKKSFVYIPLFLYMLFVTISAYSSAYKPVSLFGVADRYEGMYVLLAYTLLTIIVFNIIKSEMDIKILLTGVFISALIIALIGICQYFDMDFFRTRLGKYIILPKQFHGMVDSLEFRFGKNTIYSTLYNTNYVGSYMVMIFFILMPLSVFTKDIVKKVAFILFTVLIFSNLVGCRSRAGMIGAVTAFIIFIVCYRKEIIKKYFEVFVIMFCCVAMLLIMNNFSEGSLLKKISSTGKDFKTLKATSESKEEKIIRTIKIKNIEMYEHEIKFAFNNNRSIRLEHELIENKSVIKFFKSDNKKIDMVMYKNGKIKLSDPLYKNIDAKIHWVKIKKQKYQSLAMKIGQYKFDFIVTEEGFRVADGRTLALVVPKNPPRLKFLDGKERIGSSRGYIYSRSVPMLKDTMMLGYGPDTYSITFPQNDFLGKILAYNTTGKIIDKPHCMYLQWGINTGGISLILMLVALAFYFFQSLFIYIKADYDKFLYVIGLGIFTGFTGYCVAGIFNDSIVSVAPVFWVLFGMGMAVNNIVKKEQKKSENNFDKQ